MTQEENPNLMTNTSPTKRFAPKFWPTTIFLLLFVTLIGLGAWQVERLQWKENLISTIAARMHEAPTDVQNIPLSEADYRPATASGTFRHDQSIYLHAIERETGEGGYHVLTPLTLADGKTLFVDRGFVPFASREKKDYAQPAGTVTITGILRIPTHPMMQPENIPETGEYYWADITSLAAHFNLTAPMPFILAADSTGDAVPRGGQTQVEIPNDHRGYAITWFMLAGALLVIYGISCFRKVS